MGRRGEEFAKGVGIVSQAILKRAEMDVERRNKREDRAADFEQRWRLSQLEHELKSKETKPVFRETGDNVQRIGTIPANAELIRRGGLSERDAAVLYANDPGILDNEVLGPRIRTSLGLPEQVSPKDVPNRGASGIFGGPAGGILKFFGGVPSGQPQAGIVPQQTSPQIPQQVPQFQIGEEKIIRGKRYRFHGLDPSTGERLWEEVQ